MTAKTHKAIGTVRAFRIESVRVLSGRDLNLQDPDKVKVNPVEVKFDEIDPVVIYGVHAPKYKAGGYCIFDTPNSDPRFMPLKEFDSTYALISGE